MTKSWRCFAPFFLGAYRDHLQRVFGSLALLSSYSYYLKNFPCTALGNPGLAYVLGARL